MLERKPLPERSRSPPLEGNTSTKSTQTSPVKPEVPPRDPLGPVVVFIARAENVDDHDYPNATLTVYQMHEYLRSLLIITVGEHRKRFGMLGTRPHKMQTIIQPANRRISSISRVGKYLTSALEEARETNSECIFVLYGWDGWTTDQETIANLCDQFRDVPFFFHVYANRGSPRDFFEVSAHRFNAYYLQKVAVDDDVVIRDRSTALFIRMIEALPTLHSASCLPRIALRDKTGLSKYDRRFVDDNDDGPEIRKRGV
ncbi:hypothetical protein N7457_006912 [Penicillium paradoxum]|uniref:uncharacterized protein n=1 Tax=Penicillium paradoxum TaxID=176176 RepID=UPI002546A077|nr:uncharacterized protein N7457_006912 [Penicillium paradoxum]KAJ5779192.1 hypothetical protein N7457_006912 [Penicillium paradoxum]